MMVCSVLLGMNAKGHKSSLTAWGGGRRAFERVWRARGWRGKERKEGESEG